MAEPRCFELRVDGSIPSTPSILEITMNTLKPCPFCGKAMDIDDPDTIYPSGFWASVPGEDYRHYFNDPSRCTPEGTTYNVVCQTSAGGCSASIDGDSYKEAINNWNTRQ